MWSDQDPTFFRFGKCVAIRLFILIGFVYQLIYITLDGQVHHVVQFLLSKHRDGVKSINQGIGCSSDLFHSVGTVLYKGGYVLENDKSYEREDQKEIEYDGGHVYPQPVKFCNNLFFHLPYPFGQD